MVMTGPTTPNNLKNNLKRDTTKQPPPPAPPTPDKTPPLTIAGQPGTNPPFDKRILAIGSSGSAGADGSLDSKARGLARGFIVSKDNSKGVRFLFNPPSFSVNHTVDGTLMPTDGGNTSGAAGAPAASTSGDPNATTQSAGGPIATTHASTGFSLLFDRTYELWDASLKDTQAGQRGCFVDVMAFYDLCGITGGDAGHGAPGAFTGTSASDVFSLDAAIGPMQPTYCFVHFGGAARSLNYYGIITGIDITYTHWTLDMVPMRCVVSVSFTIMPPDSSLPPPPNSPDQAKAQPITPPKAQGSTPLPPGHKNPGLKAI